MYLLVTITLLIKSASKKILNKHNTERAKYAYALKLIDGKVNAN